MSCSYHKLWKCGEFPRVRRNVWINFLCFTIEHSTTNRCDCWFVCSHSYLFDFPSIMFFIFNHTLLYVQISEKTSSLIFGEQYLNGWIHLFLGHLYCAPIALHATWHTIFSRFIGYIWLFECTGLVFKACYQISNPGYKQWCEYGSHMAMVCFLGWHHGLFDLQHHVPSLRLPLQTFLLLLLAPGLHRDLSHDRLLFLCPDILHVLGLPLLALNIPLLNHRHWHPSSYNPLRTSNLRCWFQGF